MNIFLLHMIPKICAQMHCDLHIRKLIIEYAQILSTVHRLLDGTKINDKTSNNRNIIRYKFINKPLKEKAFYKSTHINHPCCIWARESILNYCWLYELFVNVCNEYIYRFNKVHLTDYKMRHILKKIPKNLLKTNKLNFTKFKEAMPIECIKSTPIDSYRNFYLTHKSKFATWTNRSVPFWYNQLILNEFILNHLHLHCHRHPQ